MGEHSEAWERAHRRICQLNHPADMGEWVRFFAEELDAAVAPANPDGEPVVCLCVGNDDLSGHVPNCPAVGGHPFFGSGGSQWCDTCGEAESDPVHRAAERVEGAIKLGANTTADRYDPADPMEHYDRHNRVGRPFDLEFSDGVITSCSVCDPIHAIDRARARDQALIDSATAPLLARIAELEAQLAEDHDAAERVEGAIKLGANPAEVPHCGHYDTNVHQDRCCVCAQLTGSDDFSYCPGQRADQTQEGDR